MRVKMKTVMCGPLGNFAIGQVADFDADQARSLIDGGYAEAVIAPAETAVQSPPEAAVGAPPETASMPHQRRGKRGHAA